MREEVGLLGTGEKGNRIINGTYIVLEGVDGVVHDDVDYLKKVENIKIRKQLIPISCE